MKTKGSKGLLTKVFDSDYELLSMHKSTKEACKDYGIRYKSLLSHRYRYPKEKAYTVYQNNKIKYILMWRDI